MCWSTAVNWFWRSLMVVEMAKALRIPSMARMTPMTRIRPGVVLKNHQRGWAGSVGVRCANGSVDGCASSTVTTLEPRSP